jgi:serine/threonine-protein phosphatase 2A regulatory subunit A
MKTDSLPNPLDLLREELDNDDTQIKVNAIHRLPIVMGVLSQDKIISDLIPFIKGILSTEEDEVLLAISEEIPQFRTFLDDHAILKILPLVQFLLGCEETVVRESTIVGMKKIIPTLSNEQVQNEIIPMILQIAENPTFQTKVSSCYLIRVVYPKAGNKKEKLRELYFKLCDDDTPIIKRTAAKEFGQFCLVLEKEVVHTEMVSYYKKFMTESDSVRVTILPSLVQLVKLFQNTEAQKTTIQFVVAASEDKSWRVRNELSKIFPEIIQSFGTQVIELIPTLANLIKDSETEVRLSALKGLNIILPLLKSDKTCESIVNSLISLNTESNHEVKAVIGRSFGLLARNVGYNVFNNKLGKLMDNLMKDEVAEVRLGIAKSMYDIFISSEGTLLNSINALLGNMQKDTQYSIRECVYETLAKLGIHYGLEIFKSSIENIFFNYLLDNVASVREVGIKNLDLLISKFGVNWIIGQLLPKLQNHFSTPKQSYLTRMCIIHSVAICAKYLEQKQNADYIATIILKGLKDKVSNVKFYTVKLLQGTIQYFDSPSKEKIRATVKELCKDNDIDVKYYANQFLER